MKKLFLFTLGIVLYASSFANSSGELKTALKEKVNFSETTLPIEKNSVHFVRVSFRVSEDGRVHILGANYSNNEVKELLFQKLSEVSLSDISFKEDIYYYEFTFRKE